MMVAKSASVHPERRHKFPALRLHPPSTQRRQSAGTPNHAARAALARVHHLLYLYLHFGTTGCQPTSSPSPAAPLHQDHLHGLRWEVRPHQISSCVHVPKTHIQRAMHTLGPTTTTCLHTAVRLRATCPCGCGYKLRSPQQATAYNTLARGHSSSLFSPSMLVAQWQHAPPPTSQQLAAVTSSEG